MDLSIFDTRKSSEEGAVLYIKHPVTGEELEGQAKGEEKPRKMYLRLLGRDSTTFKKAFRKLTDGGANKKAKDLTDEDIRREGVRSSRALAEITVDGEVFIDKAWVKVDKTNALDLYERLPFLPEQVTEFCINRENFMQASLAA